MLTIHILQFEFLAILLVVKTNVAVNSLNTKRTSSLEKSLMENMLIPRCQKSGAFHIRIQKNRVSHILFVDKRGLIIYLAALKKGAIRHAQPYYAIYEALPKGGGVPLLLFLWNISTFSLVPRIKFLIFYVPAPQNYICSPVPSIFRLVFPGSPEINDIIPLFPITPRRAAYIGHNTWWPLGSNPLTRSWIRRFTTAPAAVPCEETISGLFTWYKVSISYR